MTKKTFETELVRETAYGVVEKLGTRKCTMELIPCKDQYVIEWIVLGDESHDDEIVEIGIWTENIASKKITDCDGVFELPKQAIEFLKENGFDTSEVEV